MSINKKGLELIKKYEGFSEKPYRCPGGKWTIGYGHVILYHEKKSLTKVTKKQAEELLKNDVKIAEQCVDRFVSVPLDGDQFSALVSFVYNLGGGNFHRSTLRRLLNMCNYDGAAKEFPRWNRAGGRVLRGLTKRRLDEQKLFLGDHNDEQDTDNSDGGSSD